MQDCTAKLVEKQLESFPKLIFYLSEIPDPRGRRGLRHSLENILAILLAGLSAGAKTLVEVVSWAKSRSILTRLKTKLCLDYGIPDATTISRLIQKLDPKILITTIKKWQQNLGPLGIEEAYSLDGKTMRGVHQNPFRHILSLFGHKTHRILDQEAVSCKENEITASYRLLAANHHDLKNMTITADALLTQKKVLAEIVGHQANYLLTVKGNTKDLLGVIKAEFRQTDPSHVQASFKTCNHGREQLTSITLTQDFDQEYLTTEGWTKVNYVGRIIRVGFRPQLESGHVNPNLTPFYEENYFIASHEQLSPQQAYDLIKGHWQIENNLHWQKDYSYLEDRHTLRRGNSPQIMTYLRGLVISIFKPTQEKFTATTRKFLFDSRLHFDFLEQAHIF